MGSLSHTHPPDKTVTGGIVTRRRRAAALFAHMLVLLIIIIQAGAVAGQNMNTYAPPPDSNPYYGEQKFNPSMAIIMVILVGAFFAMGFLSVYVRQCNSRRRFRLEGDVSLGEGSFFIGRRSIRRATRGIDFAVIETFPTIEYSSVKGLKIGRGSLECAVCLNEFEDNDILRLLPRCNHVFHSNCIDVWLSSHTTCPVCRDNLVPKPGEKFEPSVFDVMSGQEPTLPTRTSSDQVNVHIDVELHTNLDDRTQPSGKNTVPPRSRSTGMQTLARLFPFPRSHSTGHDSLVQPGEDHERFTLRLPEEVRDEIIRNASLKRAKSSAPAFPRARSARTGFRRSTRGRSYFEYERFDQDDDQAGRRGCSMSMIPSILGRAGSIRSTMNEDVGTAPPSSQPERSTPFNGLFVRKDRDDGERSCNRLRPPVDQV